MSRLADTTTTLTIDNTDMTDARLAQSKELRAYVKKLLDGHVEANDLCPDIPVWKSLLDMLHECYIEELTRTKTKTKAINATQRLVKDFRKNDPSFDFVMKLRSAKTPVDTIEAYVPPLLRSKIVSGTYDTGSARVWLDAYIEWSMRWVPEAPYEWHELVGLWAVSTLIARRVIIMGAGRPVMTSFYALLIGDSGLGKSSVSYKATELLNRLDGLGSKLVRNNGITAQAMMRDAAAIVKENYADLPPKHQEEEQERLLYAPYRALYWEEFLAKLQQIISPSATPAMGGLKDILLNWINGEGAGNETIVNGLIKGGKRYLTAMCCGVPDTLKNLPQGSAVWTDGTLGRFHIAYARKKAPTEAVLDTSWVPDSLWMPMQMLHENLGLPQAEVLPVEQSAEQAGRNVKRIYELVRKPQSEMLLTLTDDPEVAKAYQSYKFDLELISLKPDCPSEIVSSLQRTALRTLVFAALIALSENGSQKLWCENPVIEMRHWAAAQEISERGRASLHACIEDLSIGEKTGARKNEERVIRLIARLGEQWSTFADLKNKYIKTMDNKMLTEILVSLEAQQEIVSCKCPSKKNASRLITYYGNVGAPPPENATDISDWALEMISDDNEE